MSKANNRVGIMLTDTEARVAIVEFGEDSDGVILTKAVRIPLSPDSSIEERLSGLESELYALGCHQRSVLWISCFFPEMSFATVALEKMALNKLIPLAWLKFTKEVDNLAERVVFDFEVPEEASEGVIPMWDLLAFATPYDDVAALESWFGERFDLQGITMDMFASRNLLARSEAGDESVALLACEENVSRLMHIKNGSTVFTRTIKAGSGTLLEYVEHELDREVDPEKIAAILNMSESEYHSHVNPDKAVILKACTAGADRLITQLGRALDYYTTHLKKPRPKKLFLTGNMELLKRFIPDLASRLMLEVQLLDPAMTGITVSETVADSLGAGGAECYSTAIGAALGRSGQTPNLICTHDVKEVLQKTKRTRKMVASGFIGIAAVLVIGLIWQTHQVRQFSSELQALDSNTTRGLLHLTTDYGDLKVDEIRHKHEEALLLADRYKLVSALIEVQSLTPKEVLIKNLALKAEKNVNGGLTLEGVVVGVNGPAASHLAKFVVDLNASPMFSQVFIISQPDAGEDPALRRNGVLPFKVEGRFIAALSEEKG